MLEICFFLFLVLLFYGTGRVFLSLIHWKSKYLSFTLPSSGGVVVLTIAVTWFYKLGGSLNWFFWVISIVVGVFLFWRLIAERANLFHRVARVRFEFLAMGGFAAVILLPAVLGGEQFVIFRGNHHDSFNYLEAAITYRKLSYSQISALNAAELVGQGLFTFGQDNLLARPEVSFLYGTLSSFSPGAFVRLHYVLLVYFQFLSFCAIRAAAGELLPRHRVVPLLLATALAGGFWGQYILDIDAWSQSACMPLIVLSLLILIKLTQTAGNSGNLDSVPKLLKLYALVWVGMFYLYPEAAGFLLPAHIVCWVIATCLFKLRVGGFTAGLTGLTVCGLLLPVFNSNILFLVQQSKNSLAGFNWWTYYQAFIFGRDGVNADFFSNAADFVAGALGMYFITPDLGTNPSVAAVGRTLILSGAVVLIIRFAKGDRYLLSPAWILLGSHVGVSLLCTLGFCGLQQYWTAGKALSYIAYLVLLLLVAPAFWTLALNRGWLNLITLTTAGAFLALQFGVFFYRLSASRKRFGIHYAWPYPSVQDPKLKTTINFADWSVLRHFHHGDNVAVHIEDPFMQSFVRILLLSHQIKFCIEPPAFAGGSHPSIVPTGCCLNSTVRLVAAKSPKGPFSVHLSLLGSSSSSQ